MGQMIEFASNGIDARGYLATPDGGSGPGVIVVQEWWGLDDGIKRMADRLAENGFVALAPDLYHGELAQHDEMDKAQELMESLPPDRATRDMSGAVDCLADHDATSDNGIGVVGFCMGGMLSWMLAADRPDKIRALVPFYGYPSGDDAPDFSAINAAIQGHFAENDDFFGPDGVRELQDKLDGLGKQATLTVHPGTGHAFMAEHDAMRRGTRRDAVAEVHRVPPRTSRLSVTTRSGQVRFDAVLFDAGGVLVLPDPLVLAPLLAYYGGDPDVDAHRRAHYAGMKAKSDIDAAETSWDAYNLAYVCAVGVDDADLDEAAVDLDRTRYHATWRWVIPESRAALDRLAVAGVPMGVVSNASGQIEAMLARHTARSAPVITWRCA